MRKVSKNCLWLNAVLVVVMFVQLSASNVAAQENAVQVIWENMFDGGLITKEQYEYAKEHNRLPGTEAAVAGANEANNDAAQEALKEVPARTLTYEARNKKRQAKLSALAERLGEEYRIKREDAERKAKLFGLPIRTELPNGGAIELQAIENGQLQYNIADNSVAADTISTDEVWPTGTNGFGLNGNSIVLGIWDEGSVRSTHREFGSRVTQRDSPASQSGHSTGVASTMIATGITWQAKGMAFTADLDAYDWNSYLSEMISAASSDMRFSNHSCVILRMARHLRVEFPGAIYHVTCRMVGDWRTEKTLLFKDDADHERFLERLAERVEQFNIRLYLFVCMTNHFHLVFETPEANCSKFMQSLSTAYTVYYNLRQGRHGHLLDGRYKAKLVEGDDYLLSLSRYVHLNPVQVGSQKRKPIEERIKILRAHRWSSYPSYIGRRKALDFVEYGPLLAEMHGKRREWPKRYREFVESGLAESDDDFKVALKESPRSIGSDGFRAWIDELYQKRLEKHTRPEDVSFRHISEPLPADDVLAILSEVLDVKIDEFKRRRHGSPLRAIAARYLIRYAGQSQRDVADYLVIGTGAAVSDQLKRLPQKLAKERRLRRQIKQAEAQLIAARISRMKGNGT